jgi:DNA polymerase-3 subunit delta
MVKVPPRDISRYVKEVPSNIRAVLIYGRDDGLVRERAEVIGKQITSDLSDPFQVARPSIEDLKQTPSILLDEANAISMMGGRRLVRYDGAGQEAAAPFKLLLDAENVEGLVIVTAGDLKPSSALRKAAESSKQSLAIACYEDSTRDLMGLIQSILSGASLTASQDAVHYLADNLGGDRMVSRGELEKLVLYKGSGGGQVTLEDAKACVGDTAAIGLSQIAEAVTSGNMNALERLLERAWTAGENSIAILRTLQNRLMRFHLARGYIDQGMSAPDAIGKLRPPVFFGEKDRFQMEVTKWSAKKIEQALSILMEAELDCKTTGNPADVICARTLLRLAKAAK